MQTIIMGNREDELKWWKEQKDANGDPPCRCRLPPVSRRWLSRSRTFWVAQQILDGKDLPKDLTAPFLSISEDNQEANLASTQGRRRGHGRRQVTRTETDGSMTVIAAAYQGKRLNSLNDILVHSDGSLWFTDPTFGILSNYEGYQAPPPNSPDRASTGWMARQARLPVWWMISISPAGLPSCRTSGR